MLQEYDQGFWLNNLTRSLLDSGLLKSFVDECIITGVTSNPTIYEQVIRHTDLYDEDIFEKSAEGVLPEALFFDLVMGDVKTAAGLLSTVYRETDRLDGWVSLEVSPLLANLAVSTIRESRKLYQTGQLSNLMIKIPGTSVGLNAVQETIFAGIPVNVTLLFSTEQYLAAADAYMSGIEQRIGKGLDPAVQSVASVYVSRWDVAVKTSSPPDLINQLGIAMARNVYFAHRDMLNSARWRKLAAAGARVQRIVWTSTGVKDPDVSEMFYLEALAAPGTIVVVPGNSMQEFMEHGVLKSAMPDDETESDRVIAAYVRMGFNMRSLAIQLQHQGVATLTKSWYELMVMITQRSSWLMKGTAVTL